MSNTISLRIHDFLKQFPPFNVFKNKELQELSAHIVVKYFTENKLVFEQGEMPHDYFYVVHQGAIGLSLNQPDESILVDICDEGDLFGLRALVQGDAYRLKAWAKEETILYAIPIKLFKTLIAENDKVNKYLIASFSTNVIKSFTNKEPLPTENTLETATLFLDGQKANYTQNPIVCERNLSIKNAAQLMTEKRIGSLIVTLNKKPIGIITDKDLRKKVATGLVPIHCSVEQIMSAPIITVNKNITVAEAQIIMLKYKISHLCVTDDGSINSSVLGIISEHDIVVARADNPSALIKRISRTKTLDSLVNTRSIANKLLSNYMSKQLPIDFISKIISEINNAVTKTAIEMAVLEMQQPPPVNFAWLAIGSQGREEQVLMTDQDNALVFSNVVNEDLENVRSYFITLAQKVTAKLNAVGFEYCPATMMASNPKWCLTLQEWQQQFNKWITKPTEKSILKGTIFFDFQFIYGDTELANKMADEIFTSIDTFEMFLNYLARNAVLNPAPIGFFRQFIVESDGKHKDRFDLKARAIMPLVDAARLLCLAYKIKNVNNTIERYKTLIKKEPQNKDIYESCIDSFKLLQQFRVKEGLRKQNSGRYIDLSNLSKMERLHLKTAFKPIKEVQSLLNNRYQLSHIL